jgi:hypothetical protein
MYCVNVVYKEKSMLRGSLNIYKAVAASSEGLNTIEEAEELQEKLSVLLPFGSIEIENLSE